MRDGEQEALRVACLRFVQSRAMSEEVSQHDSPTLAWCVVLESRERTTAGERDSQARRLRGESVFKTWGDEPAREKTREKL